jgi:hypothetical protein
MSNDPIEYTLRVQRVLLVLFATSFFGLSLILNLIQPDKYNIWLFLLVSCVFLTTILSLIGFWWVFSIKKIILETTEVNKLLYNSFTLSILTLFLLILNLVNKLNSNYILAVLIVYILYRVWIQESQTIY